ncbi:MAG: MBL fold metallo-hydrolase [Sphingosinicella sp.]|uniref:MBL fold metallo-hydrolase n=1 Tax=Sphingosinicella sp. TaxID=1917971 RepID=UPI004037E560
MRRILRWLSAGLLFLLVAICFAPTVIPPFLDRIYYDGPVSGQYDGARFFNSVSAPERPRRRGTVMDRMASARGEAATWPDQVPIRHTVPPRRVEGERMLVTWIGHATVLVQTAGLNIVTDPIWSERASPFSFIGPRRVRAPGVRFEDLPPIDLVLVSHNHYDHMDLPTLRRLWTRDRPVIVTSLGNDTILRKAGVESVARDWGGRVPLRDGAEVIVARNHHWGSRWFTDRNRALWSAFAVRTPSGNIFFAGDTGWGDGSWAREAAALGPYRLAILPIGAYEPREVMASNHVNPEEAMRVFEILNPVTALGMHWGTFQLTWEPIDDPWRRLAALRRARGLAPGRFVATPVGLTFSVPRAR